MATLAASLIACLGACIVLWVLLVVLGDHPGGVGGGLAMGVLLWPLAIVVGGVPALAAQLLISWPILLFIRRRTRVQRLHVMLTGLATTAVLMVLAGLLGNGGTVLGVLIAVLPASLAGAATFSLFIPRPALDSGLASD